MVKIHQQQYIRRNQHSALQDCESYSFGLSRRDVFPVLILGHLPVDLQNSDHAILLEMNQAPAARFPHDGR